ncbi:uncharacterized protein PpBr36_11522 [Pyricularia pennisetigena]|uniref:uncharacterized protein n=1 Tax=Pyricularia pennisetigena TaxID=1578925 RepID=UPI0011518A4D|nr:uncharacterized protein PpBr36_11522 [Pyricularia pennisetigena]TLS20216.1 hypothetical protein PpBr36_11522 [Pyricularia pennisetigena]
MIAQNFVLAILPLLSLAGALPIVQISPLGPLSSNAALDGATSQGTTNDPPADSAGVQRRDQYGGVRSKPKPFFPIFSSFKWPRLPGQTRFPGTGRRLGSASEETASTWPDALSSEESTKGRSPKESVKGQLQVNGQRQSHVGPHSFKTQFGSPNNFENEG